MKIFNFLTKKEGKKGGLDIPPPPPPNLQRSFSIPNIPKIEVPKPYVPKIEVPKPAVPKIDLPEIAFKPKIDIPKKPMEPIMFRPSMPKPEFKPKVEQYHGESSKIIPEKHATQKELFVRTENFTQVIDNINTIKKKVKESEKSLARLNEIKNAEDKEYERWHSQLEEVQRKLNYVDKTLFEVSKNG